MPQTFLPFDADSSRRLIRTHALVALLLLAASVVQAEVAPDLSDAAITQRYEQRREFILSQAVAAVVPGDLTKGSKFDIAACLQRGEKVGAALARLARLDGGEPSGNMFWVYPTVAVMMAGDRTLDEASKARIAELWRAYWPSRGDTENHWVLTYASLYLAAQAYPGAGPEHWFNGKSSAENMAEARDYLDRVAANAERMGTLIDALLSFGHLARALNEWQNDDTPAVSAATILPFRRLQNDSSRQT